MRRGRLDPCQASVRLGGLIKVETGVAGRHFVNPIRVQVQRLSKHVKGLLGVPIWMVSGHESLISPPELDPRPVDGRVRSLVAKSRIGPGGNAPTGKCDLGNPEVPLDLGESRHQPCCQSFGDLIGPGVKQDLGSDGIAGCIHASDSLLAD